MQHVVNKVNTCLVAANLISSNLAHAGKHNHGSSGHNEGRGRAPKAEDVQVLGGSNQTEGGR